MRIYLRWAAIGGLFGAAIALWLAPSGIIWWYTPPAPSPSIFNCREAISWALNQLRIAQLVIGTVCALLGLLIARAVSKKKNGELSAPKQFLWLFLLLPTLLAPALVTATEKADWVPCQNPPLEQVSIGSTGVGHGRSYSFFWSTADRQFLPAFPVVDEYARSLPGQFFVENRTLFFKRTLGKPSAPLVVGRILSGEDAGRPGLVLLALKWSEGVQLWASRTNSEQRVLEVPASCAHRLDQAGSA